MQQETRPNTKFPYFTQCDKWRRKGDNAENGWHEMMANASSISQADFISKVEVYALLDEDESMDEFVAGDPEHGFYKSSVNGQVVYFLQHAGFEFIFTPKGDDPCHLLEDKS